MVSVTGLKVRFNCGAAVVKITSLSYSHSIEVKGRSIVQVIVTDSPTVNGLLCPDTSMPAVTKLLDQKKKIIS